MFKYEDSVSIAILDYNREKESRLLIDSIKRNAKFNHKIVYISNGGNHKYSLEYLENGLIDTLITNRENLGCGIGTRQAIQSCLSEYVMYVQVDQVLGRVLTQETIDFIIFHMKKVPDCFYVDLAGNQGHGSFSERASLLDREKYLAIPKMNETIGGPGPYANYQWTENLVQEHIKSKNVPVFIDERVHYFFDNGKWSVRTYPCGAETLHSTDEKRLFILKPFKQKYFDFPNLNLNDEEWKMAFDGTWPKDGLIPEADKKHSFIFWKE